MCKMAFFGEFCFEDGYVITIQTPWSAGQNGEVISQPATAMTGKVAITTDGEANIRFAKGDMCAENIEIVKIYFGLTPENGILSVEACEKK